MESLGQAGLAAAAVAAVLVVLRLAVTARREAREEQARQSAAAAELARSRAEVEALSRRLEDVAAQLEHVRRDAARSRDRQPEYVITTLTANGESERLPEPPQRPVSDVLEDQLVDALARHREGSPLRSRVVDVVVRTVSLGHGVRRALSPDVLDRAAAEAHVARRRSRRERRREVREARRLVRAVREQNAA